MFEAIVWIAGGAFVGWLFSLSELQQKRSTLLEISAGALGGFLGGVLMWAFYSNAREWNSLRILVSVVSAASMIAVIRFLKK